MEDNHSLYQEDKLGDSDVPIAIDADDMREALTKAEAQRIMALRENGRRLDAAQKRHNTQHKTFLPKLTPVLEAIAQMHELEAKGER